jgi:hydroxypyruvate isomerase
LLEKAVRYIAYKLQCVHPFVVSRVLVLVNWKMIEKTGSPVVKMKVEGFEAGFYIPEFKKYFETECFQKDEHKKCCRYICGEPDLPQEIKKVIDEVIEEVRELDEQELNRRVIGDPRYKKLLEAGGFI